MKKILLVILFFVSNASALTLTQVRTNARSLIGDLQVQRYTNEEMNYWINEGQRLMDSKSLCVYNSTSITTSSGTIFYALPDDFMTIRRVTSDYLSLPELSPASLDGRSMEWETSTGEPTNYFINFSTRTKIGFYPYPVTNTTTTTVRVEYMGYSTELTTDSQVPFNGIKEFYTYHYALVYYAAFKASITDEKDGRSKVYLDSFVSLSDLMKQRCVERPNYLPQMSAKQ